MKQKINKTILFFLLIFISLILIFAYMIEYKLGFEACKLCIYQRVPYFLSILLIIEILFFKKYEKVTLLLLSFIFFISLILAFYHFGIEQGFFDESTVCASGDVLNTLNKEELLQELKKNTISCKNVNFKILGFSLASINFILSFIFSVIFMKMFLNYGKN